MVLEALRIDSLQAEPPASGQRLRCWPQPTKPLDRCKVFSKHQVDAASFRRLDQVRSRRRILCRPDHREPNPHLKKRRVLFLGSGCRLGGTIKETFGGEGGIRTPGTIAGTSDFESGALNRALPPLRFYCFHHFNVRPAGFVIVRRKPRTSVPARVAFPTQIPAWRCRLHQEVQAKDAWQASSSSGTWG